MFRFNQEARGKDYLDEAVDFRKKLVKILGINTHKEEIIGSFDTDISEQVFAYMDEINFDENGYALIMKLEKCYQIGQFWMKARIDDMIGKSYEKIVTALEQRILQSIENTPLKFLDVMFWVFHLVSINKQTTNWMEVMIKNFIARFIPKAWLTASNTRARNAISILHEKAIKEYSPGLPVELQPIFEKLVNISRGQFWMNENYPVSENKWTWENPQWSKFRIMP